MKKTAHGFTLIELLLAIAVLAVVSTFVIISFRGAQDKARDAKRQSELRQFQNLIEIYANQNNGIYPMRIATDGARSEVVCGDMGLSTSECVIAGPNPYHYRYQSDGAGSQYTLWILMESRTDENFVICSTGQSGFVSTSSFPISSGNCPI